MKRRHLRIIFLLIVSLFVLSGLVKVLFQVVQTLFWKNYLISLSLFKKKLSPGRPLRPTFQPGARSVPNDCRRAFNKRDFRHPLHQPQYGKNPPGKYHGKATIRKYLPIDSICYPFGNCWLSIFHAGPGWTGKVMEGHSIGIATEHFMNTGR